MASIMGQSSAKDDLEMKNSYDEEMKDAQAPVGLDSINLDFMDKKREQGRHPKIYC